MLSPDTTFKIADIVNPIYNTVKGSAATLTEIYELESLPFEQISDSLLIKKDLDYLRFRYIDYPFRRYRFFRLDNGGRVALFVLRLTEVNGAFAIRIVDYLGDPADIAACGECLQKLLTTFKAEYLDFYCAGIDDEQLYDAGFNIRNDTDKNIIPNYTEPLDRQNIDFYYFTSDTDGFTMFRADGDGDRPILS